jgi:imidazolonepropionase-like amidohydrolase
MRARRGIAGLAGGITPGTLADLLLRDANPLDNIRNTRRIVAVVRRGRLFTRKNLDALLASARRNAATPVRR